MVITNGYLLSKVLYSALKALVKEKTRNSCGAFLSKPRTQTVVNQFSCGFNPSLSQIFFFSFWTFLDRCIHSLDWNTGLTYFWYLYMLH